MDRIEDLIAYKILDTDPERELDEMAEIAAAICETPVSIISFIDEKRQWYKAKIGISKNEVPLKDTFCRHTLDKPEEVLVVSDPSEDERFKNNPDVLAQPGIKFYAGAPLVSKHGNVLGTVCVVDFKENEISTLKRKALQLVSKKVMEYLEARRLLIDRELQIDWSAKRLKKLTDLAPGMIFKLSSDQRKNYEFIFLSKGVSKLFPGLDVQLLKSNPKLLIQHILEEDKSLFLQKFLDSYETLTPIDLEYRMKSNQGELIWHWLKANPEDRGDGKVVWYGTIQDITQKKSHLEVLEKMLFDLSHVIRKPVANVMGLLEIMQSHDLDIEEKAEYYRSLEQSILELEKYVGVLNQEYFVLKQHLKKNWS